MQSGMIGTKNLGIDFGDIDEEKQEKFAAELPISDTVVTIEIDPKSRESFYIKITEKLKEKTRCGG